jgi:hypothetical protein
VAGVWFCAISVPAAVPAAPFIADGPLPLVPVLAEQCSDTIFTSVTCRLFALEFPVEPAVEVEFGLEPVLELPALAAEPPLIEPITWISCPT